MGALLETEDEILIAGLLVAVAGLSAPACYHSVRYPIVLVVVAQRGFVTGLPEDKLEPRARGGRLVDTRVLLIPL